MKYVKTSIAVFVLLAVVALISSCYYDKEILMDRTPVITEEVSFSKDIIPIFTQSCVGAGCHSGSVAPDLSVSKAYNALINGNYINTADPSSSNLYLWMSGKKSLPMPLTGPNKDYNAKVLAWIRQGALNN